MSDALARIGAIFDKWEAEQRLRRWAQNLADGEASTPLDQVNRLLIGRSVENR